MFNHFLIERRKYKMKNIFILCIALLLSSASMAQVKRMYNPGTTYQLSRLESTTVTRDTVTDTGTGALYSKRLPGDGPVTIQINQTKVSGTVAGSLTLYGSLDGVYYTAINTEETQTAIATKTVTDASGVTAYNWRLKTNVFMYYKVGAAGGTSCVYYLDGYIKLEN
jgi:hypothetical protein